MRWGQVAVKDRRKETGREEAQISTSSGPVAGSEGPERENPCDDPPTPNAAHEKALKQRHLSLHPRRRYKCGLRRWWWRSAWRQGLVVCKCRHRCEALPMLLHHASFCSSLLLDLRSVDAVDRHRAVLQHRSELRLLSLSATKMCVGVYSPESRENPPLPEIKSPGCCLV